MITVLCGYTFGDTSSDTPGNIPGDTPGNIPGDTPGNIPGDTPGKISGDTPGNVPGDTPGKISGDTPDHIISGYTPTNDIWLRYALSTAIISTFFGTIFNYILDCCTP
ncbi:hypothetical protein MUCCIDRAFT_167168 [Mucor lusitanicus CBS 277.49]|uniref:Uncharacterized protein n=1 Tax=Mucor lusitanicus CBS 277.49 TaxID=747725 RepID=A0A162Q3Y9_MUCCL|nr:hypothetical protein MUCCIDRAFT_167168 [Mucor lusitanicus CBS 277.49]